MRTYLASLLCFRLDRQTSLKCVQLRKTRQGGCKISLAPLPLQCLGPSTRLAKSIPLRAATLCLLRRCTKILLLPQRELPIYASARVNTGPFSNLWYDITIMPLIGLVPPYKRHSSANLDTISGGTDCIPPPPQHHSCILLTRFPCRQAGCRHYPAGADPVITFSLHDPHIAN